jgi:hypothetical protein
LPCDEYVNKNVAGESYDKSLGLRNGDLADPKKTGLVLQTALFTQAKHAEKVYSDIRNLMEKNEGFQVSDSSLA